MIQILKKNKSLVVILFAIFICSLGLRTVFLSKFPVGFQIDEASLGYNAYSILHTGKSEAGIFLPLYVDTFGDNRPTGYNYVDIPFIAIFGLTVTATRLPSALFGALGVFAIFYLSYVITHRKKTAIFSALFLAFAPWNIVLSRASAETIIALFFVLLGFALVLSYLKTKHNSSLVMGTVLLALSFFFYHTPRVFVPINFFVILLVFFYPYKKIFSNKDFQKLIVSLVLLCMVSFSLIFLIKGGTGRFTQVNIFNFPETQLVMAEEIREDGTFPVSILQTRVFHNKVVNYILTFSTNYFAYFSGDFLFMHGGLPNWYQVDEMGLLYLIECPFIIYGVYQLAKSKDRLSKVPLFWVLLAPVTASFTVDDIPNIQRAIVLFPMLEIIAAVGFVQLIENSIHMSVIKTSKAIRYGCYSIFCLLYLFGFFYFLHQYSVHGQTHRPWFRNNGFQDMITVVAQKYNSYDKIYTTKSGGGYPLFLFFMHYDPAMYQKEGSLKDATGRGFGKFIFESTDCPSTDPSVKRPKNLNVLYVDRGTCKLPNKKTGLKYTNIVREDGTIGFRVLY